MWVMNVLLEDFGFISSRLSTGAAAAAHLLGHQSHWRRTAGPLARCPRRSGLSLHDSAFATVDRARFTKFGSTCQGPHLSACRKDRL
jgi:hypothetical protein